MLDIQTHLQLYHIGQAVSKLSKVADAPVATYSLSGRLYISKSGWLLLSVPNAMARGMFDALDENGIELPTKDGVFNAHVSVMTKEEVDSIGGPDKITERGHTYLYQIGAIKTVRPAGWKEMSRVWFVDVKSPDLEALRKSYGLTPLPHGDHPFHVTIAVRRKNVLYDNELSKTSSEAPFEDSYKTELSQLAEIKADSDKRNYKAKHHKIRAMVAKKPKDWEVSNHNGHYSFKHKSGYKYHIPVAKMASMLDELTKAAAPIAPIGPARRKKKKKQPETHPLNPGGLAIGAGVLGGGALAGAYGMASDGQAQHLTDAIQRYKTPLAPYETGATRYQDIMSAGASMRPFGMPVGEIISGARSSPRIMSMAGTPDYVANKPGSFQEARMHYDSFRKGPIASYFHQLRAKGLYEPASPAFQPAAVGTAAPEKLTYDKLMQPKFEEAFKTWRAKQQKAPNGLLQGASGWLEPWEIDTTAVPHNAQLEFMRDYYEGLPADLKAERQRVETDKWGPGLANNANNYRPIIENGLSARNTLKDVGITASGAAGGAALGHYLHRLFAGKKKKNQRDGLGYYASTLGGGALGGGAAYLLGTQHGSQTLQKLIGLLGQKKAASYLQKAIEKTPIKYDPNQTGLGNLARYTEQVQHSGNLMLADDNAAIDLGTSLNPAKRRARFLSSLKGNYSTIQLTPAEKLVLDMPFRQLMGQ